MQTAGYFVSLSAKFTTGVERGHYGLKRRYLGCLVNVDRNTATVVGNAHSVTWQKHYLDIVGKATHRLVAGVIEDFPH